MLRGEWGQVALIVQKRHQVGALVHEVGEDEFEEEVEPPGGISVLGRAVSRPMPNG